MGPRGSAAEDAFCRTLTDQKQGVNGLLAIAAPNMMVKPNTVMFNKVTIKDGRQAVQMFGPAQRGVAMAVMECVEDGTIPLEEADDVFICVGVFIDHNADIDERIQDWNYRATKIAIKSAIAREPKAADVVKLYKEALHPFAATKNRRADDLAYGLAIEQMKQRNPLLQAAVVDIADQAVAQMKSRASSVVQD
jgi:5,6,7,8-tetrahydromethanopterin hydro-lyase